MKSITVNYWVENLQKEQENIVIEMFNSINGFS